LSNQQNY